MTFKKHQHPGNATPAEIEAVKAHYATMGPKRLAAQLGVTPSRLKHIAALIGVRCGRVAPPVSAEMRRIHAAASAPGGVSMVDLADGSAYGTHRHKVVSAQADRMCRPASVLRVYRRAGIVNGRVMIRIFASVEQADAFSPHEYAADLCDSRREEMRQRRNERQAQAAKRKRDREREAEAKALASKRQAAANDAPVRVANSKGSIAGVKNVICNVEPTVCPSPEFYNRVSIRSGEKVPALFAALRPGQYLEDAA